MRMMIAGMVAFLLLPLAAVAQAPKPPELKLIEVKDPGGQILSFRHRVTTEVRLRGTGIVPDARIKLKVESRPGFLEIDINSGDIKALSRAHLFGKDFLTYVMWAVSVDGKAQNIGEITFEGKKPKAINVTTPYQTFWLMVTAEPDYAVIDPSPLVVLYSLNQAGMKIREEKKAQPIPGKLFYFTHYSDYETMPGTIVRDVPNEILQARKAIQLASQAGILASPPGADASDEEQRAWVTLEQAKGFLAQAEKAFKTKKVEAWEVNSEAIQFSRTAAQIAENARALALGAVGGIFIRQLEDEVARLKAELARLQRDMEALRTQSGPMREENERLRGENKRLSGQIASLRSQMERLQSELASCQDRLQRAESELASERARAEEAGSKLMAANELLARLEAANQRLLEDRNKICGELQRQLASLGQLNQQGGNMVLTLASDILFDSGSYQLRSIARENLAKLAILQLLIFPDANVSYEGHTDLVGEEDYNQWLSEQRAMSVYRYFLGDAIARESDPGRRATAQVRQATVDHLLKMNWRAAQRSIVERQEMLAGLEGAVSGQGERQPVVNTQRSEEKNRRVVLLFPPAQAGQFSSICESQPQG